MDFRKRIRFVRWSFFSKHKKQECTHAAREFPLVFSQRETKRAAGSSPRPPHGPAAAVSREPRPNPFGEPSQTRCACAASAYSPAFQTHGKARFLLLRNKILRALPWPTESYLRRSLFSTQICFVKPIFAHRMLLRSRWLKSQNSSHANPSSTETLTEGQGSRALRLLRGS